MPEQTLNLSKVYVESPTSFVLLALGLAMGVRCILALLKCYEVAATHPSASFWLSFARVVGGLAPSTGPTGDEGKGDYLTSLLVGLLELLIYPALMAGGFWTFIGAWIAFKTAAQYKHWSASRSMFNRFLAGNALVVLLAFSLLVPWVRFGP